MEGKEQKIEMGDKCYPLKLKEAKSISEVDYSGLRIPAVVIYDRPDDFPGYIIGRLFDLYNSIPTDTFIRYETMIDVNEDLKEYVVAEFPRNAKDTNALICTCLLR